MPTSHGKLRGRWDEREIERERNTARAYNTGHVMTKQSGGVTNYCYGSIRRYDIIFVVTHVTFERYLTVYSGT